MEKTSFELLTAAAGDTLEATWTESSVDLGARVDSKNQFEFFIEYTPIAAEITAGTAELHVRVLYTDEPADKEDESGGNGTISWKRYMVTADRATPPTGVLEKDFKIKEWTIPADDVGADAADSAILKKVHFGINDPAFVATRIKLEFAELTRDNAAQKGNVKARIGHRCY